MARTLIAAGFKDVHRPERAARVARAEPKILVIPRPVLTIEVDVKQLAVPERLGEPVGEVQACHLLVTDLGVDADHLRMLELVDEGKRMSDGGKEDVAAWFVGLGLDGETHVVALLDDIPGEDVEGFLVTVESGTNILCGARLRTLTPAPENDDSRTQLGCEVEVVRHLAERKAPHLAIICGERAVAKHRMRKQIGRHHWHHQSGGIDRMPQAVDRTAFLGGCRVEREDVVIVEADPVRAELCQFCDRELGVERRADCRPENVNSLPSDGPESE